MRCHDVKQVLAQQQDIDEIDNADMASLLEHLELCDDCRSFKHDQSTVDALLKTSQKSFNPASTYNSSSTGHISTNTIMQAVQQRKQISQQLETLHEQQRCRIERIRTGGTVFIAILFFALGSIPLLLLAIMLVQTDFMVHVLLLLSSVFDILYVLVQYAGTGLVVVTHNGLLLTGVGFAVVLMMGMWLRLMRPPREA